MGNLFVYSSFVFICASAPFRPAIGALGYIGFVAFCPQFLWRFSLADPSFEFQKYIALTTCAGCLLSGFKGARFERPTKIAVACLCFYLAVSCVSSFQSENPERSWFFMNNIYKIVLMSVVAIRLLDTPKVLYAALVILLLGVGWNAIEINRDYLSQGFSNVNADGWAFQNANGYALVLVLAAFMSISLTAAIPSVLGKALFAGFSLAEVHAIYIVESRGGMIGLIAGGICWAFFVKKTFSTVTTMLLVVAGSLVLAGPSVVDEFMSSFAGAEKLDQSAESRYYIWRAGAEISLDYPLLGVGPWAAEGKVAEYYKAPGGRFMERIHLHNLPLELSTGSGVPAAVAYCVFFFLPLFHAAQRLRRGPATDRPVTAAIYLGVLSGMVGYWVASFFNSGALIEVPYLCMVLVIATLTLEANFEHAADGSQFLKT